MSKSYEEMKQNSFRKPDGGGDLSRNIKKLYEVTVYGNSTVGMPKAVRNVLDVGKGDKAVWWLVNGQLVLRAKIKHPNKTKGDY